MNPDKRKLLLEQSRNAALNNSKRQAEYCETLAVHHGQHFAGAIFSAVAMIGFSRKLLDMLEQTGMPDNVCEFLDVQLMDLSTDVLAWALALRFGDDPANEAASQSAMLITHKMLQAEFSACDAMAKNAADFKKGA